MATHSHRRARKLTPKERVMRQYPKATCIYYNGFCAVYGNVTPGLSIGYVKGGTPRGAWADAARRLK